MLDTIVSSKTRLKILLKFFLTGTTESYLRCMEREFNESSNSIRIELKRFTEAGLLSSELKGKKRFYKANRNHPMYNDIHQMVLKTIGIDQILECISPRINNLQSVFIIGDFANGVESETIELAFVGKKIDEVHISECVKKAESLIPKKIMHLIYTPSQLEYFFQNKPHLVIWQTQNDSAVTDNLSIQTETIT